MSLPHATMPSPVPCPVCGSLAASVFVVVDADGRPLWYRCVWCGPFGVGTK